MNRGRVNAQDLCGLANRHNLPGGWLRRWLETRNVAIATQAADMKRREAFTARRCASLTIENAGDHVVRVMHGQTTKLRDHIFVGVEAARLHARQGQTSFCESTASPAQGKMSAPFIPIDGHNHLFQKS